VTEAWIRLSGEMSAARLLFKRVIASRGIGLGQLGFVLEVSSRREAADGQALWLGGNLRLMNVGTSSGYLAPLSGLYEVSRDRVVGR
jgi:hypothetical protein